MNYDFSNIEKKWQDKWRNDETYKVSEDSQKQKYYVLDMFPYPSGAGLHVGHPLGYIASDIFARYKRLKGFNVLHPMGYDSFGLPTEQYAITTGIHPAIATKDNTGEISTRTNKKLVNVFVPTTPNPTSGFLLMFPKDEIIYLDMTFEEASKFIVSAGTSEAE